MRLRLGGLVLVGAVSIWAGFSSWPSTAVLAKVWAALAIFCGGLVFLSAWVWWRARPGSGDALMAPALVGLSLAGPISIVPAALWPDAAIVRAAASVAGAIVAIAAAVAQFRTLRRLRQERNSL